MATEEQQQKAQFDAQMASYRDIRRRLENMARPAGTPLAWKFLLVIVALSLLSNVLSAVNLVLAFWRG